MTQHNVSGDNIEPNLLSVEFERNAANHARELAHSHGLKTCDAIHLGSAISATADVFLTFDKADYPIGTHVEDVWVDTPYFPGDTQQDLFSSQADD